TKMIPSKGFRILHPLLPSNLNLDDASPRAEPRLRGFPWEATLINFAPGASQHTKAQAHAFREGSSKSMDLNQAILFGLAVNAAYAVPPSDLTNRAGTNIQIGAANYEVVTTIYANDL